MDAATDEVADGFDVNSVYAVHCGCIDPACEHWHGDGHDHGPAGPTTGIDLEQPLFDGAAEDPGALCACGHAHDHADPTVPHAYTLPPAEPVLRYPGGTIPIDAPTRDFPVDPPPGDKWGDPAPGTPGGVVTWSLVGAGFDVDIPEDPGINVTTPTVDPDEAYPFDVEAVLRAQLDKWSVAADIDFIQVADDGSDFFGPSDIDIRIAHAPIELPVLGFAFFPTVGEIVMSTTLAGVFADTEADSTEALYTHVALHEIGHAIGLTHTPDPSAVMFAFATAVPTELQPNDIGRIQLLYGPQDNNPFAVQLDAEQPNFSVAHTIMPLAVTGDRAVNSIAGSAGDDRLDGGAGADTLDGRGGNDLLIGGPGADRHIGGAGFDTVLIRAGFDPASLVVTGETARVDGERGAFEELSGVERAVFENGVLAIPTAESEIGFLQRLYLAVFGRDADAGALFWEDALVGGVTRLSVAESFVDSLEFRERFPDDEPEAFVDRLFEFVLGREADAGGRAFWLDELAGGMSEAEAVLSFVESPEFVAATEEDVAGGVFFAGAQAQFPELFA